MRRGTGGVATVQRGVKGSLFGFVAGQVQALMAGGRLGPGVLERFLNEEDRRLVAETHSPGSWYPIDTYDRMLQLLAHKEAGGQRPEYFIEGGREAAERLAALGIYRQFDRTSSDLTDFLGRVLVTLSGALYNFMTWKWGGWNEAHDAFTIEVSGAADFPDSCRLRAQGFVEKAAMRSTGHHCVVTSRRVDGDRVIYHAQLKDPLPRA